MMIHNNDMNRSILYYLAIGAVIGLLLSNFVGSPLVGVGVGLAIGLGAWVMRGRGGSVGTVGGGGVYQELLSKARGDKALVERLVAFEQKRNPNGSRQDWVADALDRWERDRG